MKVLFASAEFAPLARVGGLAAAAAGLVAELRRHDVDVQVVLPDYFSTPMQGEKIVDLEVPDWAGPAKARTGTVAGVGRLTLIKAYGIERSPSVPAARRPRLARQRSSLHGLLGCGRRA